VKLGAVSRGRGGPRTCDHTLRATNKAIGWFAISNEYRHTITNTAALCRLRVRGLVTSQLGQLAAKMDSATLDSSLTNLSWLQRLGCGSGLVVSDSSLMLDSQCIRCWPWLWQPMMEIVCLISSAAGRTNAHAIVVCAR
jgi:hypothetical protein